MKRKLLLSVFLVLLVVALGTGCGGGRASIVVRDESPTAQRGEEGKATSVPTLDPQKEEAMTPTPASEAMEVEIPAGAEGVVALAREDLAGRLDLAPEAIHLQSVEVVEWSDASLGCPQPGMMYAQVVTPGFRVVLEVERNMYEYHTDRGQNAILCEKESTMDVPTVPSPVEPGSERLVNLAKEDLAQRLSISVDQIELLEAKAVVWPDGGLGCPQPGMVYTQVPLDGALIRLRFGGRVYDYHSGGGRGPFLCEKKANVLKATPEIGGELLPPPRSPSD